MTATDVARALRPHLWAGRNTRHGAHAWTEAHDFVAAVLEHATLAPVPVPPTREQTLAAAAAHLDADGHHDLADHVRAATARNTPHTVTRLDERRRG